MFEVDYVEPVTLADKVAPPFPRPIINPFPNQTPEHMLGRPEVLYRGDFLDSIADDYLQWWVGRKADYLSRFSYFRADFKLQFVFRTSGTQYGYGMISWWRGPYPEAIPNYTIEKSSTADSYLIDYTACDAIEIEIPWVYRRPYIVLSELEQLRSYFSVVFKQGVLKTISTGADASVHVAVYMTAHNIDVGGMKDKPVVVQGHSLFKQKMDMPSQPSLLRSIGTLASMTMGVAPVLLQTAINQFVGDSDNSGSTNGNAAQGVKIAMYGNLNEISQTPSKQIPLLAEGDMHSPMYPPSHHKLVDIAKIPGIIATVDFTTKDQKLIIPLTLGPWGDMIATHFRGVRGTSRVGLHFFTHPLLAARFAVQMNTNDQITTNDPNSTDIPTLVFLVKGSDSKMIDCPYHHDTFIRQTTATGVAPFNNLTVQMTAAPTEFATGVDTSVLLVVTMSAAEDVQYFSVRNIPGKDFDPTPPIVLKDEAVVVAHSIRRLHSQTAEICMGSITTPQVPFLPEVNTVEQLAQRWSRRVISETYNDARYQVTPMPFSFTSMTEAIRDGQELYGCKYDVIATWFYMARASLDIRVVLGTAASGITEAWVAMADGISSSSTGVLGAKDPANGITLTRNDQQPILEYRVPFISIENGAVRNEVTYITAVNSNVATFAVSPKFQEVYARATEDIQLTHINILPPLVSKPQV